MLFSAGIFLYVVIVYVFLEVLSLKIQYSNLDGSVVIKEYKGFRVKDLVVIVFGVVLSVIFFIGYKYQKFQIVIGL